MSGSATTAISHLLLISLDRVISIKAPVYYDSHLKLGKRQLPLQRVSIALFMAMYTWTSITAVHVSISEETGLCGVEMLTSLQLATSLTSVVVGQFVPFTVLLISNIIFSVTLLTRRFRRAQNQRGTETPAVAAAKIEKDYVKMLFILTASFLVFHTTSSAALLMSSDEDLANPGIGLSLCFLFSSMNYSCNFFFYLISGPMFREALRKAFQRPQNSAN